MVQIIEIPYQYNKHRENISSVCCQSDQINFYRNSKPVLLVVIQNFDYFLFAKF